MWRWLSFPVAPSAAGAWANFSGLPVHGGMCGSSKNQDASDDLKLPSGKLVANPYGGMIDPIFGTDWETTCTETSCNPKRRRRRSSIDRVIDNPCKATQNQMAEYIRICQNILGSYSFLIENKTTIFIDNCAFDRCVFIQGGANDTTVDNLLNEWTKVADHELFKQAHQADSSVCKPKRACEKKNGVCQPIEDECNGKLRRSRKWCRNSATCGCCIPTIGVSTPKPCLSDALENRINNLTLGLNAKLDFIINRLNLVCPEGFFMSPGSNQCFKAFVDRKRSWEEADSQCKSEGLVLAKPYNAVAIRKYLVERYADSIHDRFYVGARGDGSQLVWQRDGLALSSISPLWFPNLPGSHVTTDYCLFLMTSDDWLTKNPEQPYYSFVCSQRHYMLCERIVV